MISSSTDSPIRSSPQVRGQSLFVIDPLLCDLTHVTIIRPSASEVLDFEPREKEWSLRAAEGTVKVNEWLGEVEGWDREWRQTYRESKDAGDGHLPPADRLEKGPETVVGSTGEEDEGAMLDCSMPVRRSFDSEDNGGSGDVILKDDRPEVGAVEATKPQTNSSGLRRGGKPWTPPQLKMQGATEVGNSGISGPEQVLANTVAKIGAKGAREEKQEEVAAMEAAEKERSHEGANDQSGTQEAALHAGPKRRLMRNGRQKLRRKTSAISLPRNELGMGESRDLRKPERRLLRLRRVKSLNWGLGDSAKKRSLEKRHAWNSKLKRLPKLDAIYLPPKRRKLRRSSCLPKPKANSLMPSAMKRSPLR